MNLYSTLTAKVLAFVAIVLLLGAASAQQASREDSLPATDMALDSRAGSSTPRRAPPGFAGASIPTNPAAPDATSIGDAVCSSCHALETVQFTHTVHDLGLRAAAQSDVGSPGCETCHGPGSEHAKQPLGKGLIIGFTRGSGTPIQVQTSTCLACHSGGPRNHWLGSVHERFELSCSDCHNPMGDFSAEGLMARQSISETCATCHRDIRAQFNRRSHMPLPEGQMSCTDCHNPHGSLTAPLLKTDTLNETCYQCHAEKRGPFLFEHAPVRDSCVNCHTPHGSNQQALLVAPVPFLCQQCHSHVRHPNDLLTAQSLGTGSFPDERLMARGCIACHAQVHGSNHPSGPRFHR